MKSIYKECVNMAKSSICGKLVHNKNMRAVEADIPGEEKPRKWNFCEKCCRSTEQAKNIQGQLYVHFWCPPAEG